MNLVSHRLLFLTLFAFASSTLIGTATAQHSEKGPAYPVPPEKDAQYHLMGEFVGKIKTGKKQQTLALQVRPIAGDQFHAIAYFGGLPGTVKREVKEMKLIGLRSEKSVVLSGGPWALFVDAEGCNVVAGSGKKLGRLKRVQRVSPTLGAEPPKGAVVVFDGTNVDQLVDGQMTDNGLLKEGSTIVPMFQDFNLHVEFRLPYMPKAEGQQRGNSGLYLQSRYECQVLDSFGTEIMFNGLGSLYRQRAPDHNMAFPPLTWQTYDVRFTAPRWSFDGKKIRNARITSWVNGVKVQDDVELKSKTGAGQQEAPTLLPIKLQNHGDPVRFRNIWIVDRGIVSGKFPVQSTAEQRAAVADVGWEGEKTRLAAEAKKKAEAEAKKAEEAAKQAEAEAKKKAEAAKRAEAEAKKKAEAEAAKQKEPAAEEPATEQAAESASPKSGEQSA